MKLAITALASVSALAFATAASAKDYYATVSGGISLLSDSDNDGAFVGDFTTGAGTTIASGTVLPDGTPVGWTTDFDNGYAINGAIGKGYGPFRAELEIGYQQNDVGSHAGVAAGGIDLSAEDAGVLVTGSGNLGTSVADLVAAGEGDVSTLFVMANLIYDVETPGPLTPYIGGGIGVGFVDVEYAPSGVGIIDDSATTFAYQVKAGLAYELTPLTDLFVGYRYRATTDAEVEATLFSADFDIENSASVIEAGITVGF
ncbi:MAG: P44/Msp2 family outer membrane protein [Pseudomonadota bacterium]